MPEDMAFQEKATRQMKTRLYYIIESEHIYDIGYNSVNVGFLIFQLLFFTDGISFPQDNV
jgi:hypothetical protein